MYREAVASEQERINAGQKIVAASKRIAALLRYAQHAFGMLNFPCHTGQAASLSAYNLLGFIDQPEVPDLLHTMIVTLTAVCQRWPIIRGIIRSLWIKVKDLRLEDHLLEPTVSLLKLNGVENWGPNDHSLFESCTYPNYTHDDVRNITGVGDLLASYALLNLSGADQ